MRCISYRGVRGFTLVEVLVAVTVTGMLVAGLCLMLSASSRVWRRCSAQSKGFPPAYTIVTRINQELKNAISKTITPSDTITGTDHLEDKGKAESDKKYRDTLTFCTPLTDGDGTHGTNLYPFQAGREIIYYPKLIAKTDSNSNGTEDAGEQWRYEMWRKETDLIADTLVSDRKIAENILLPSYTCEQTESKIVLAIYSTMITVVGEEGSTKFNNTFRSVMAIRNTAG